MPREQIIIGVDVGTHYVQTVVASYNPDLPLPQIIGSGSARMQGMRKGTIIDIEDAARSIQKSVHEAEKVSGIQVKKAYVSLSGDHIVSMPSRGVIAVSRADGEITQGDVERVVEAASTIALPKNREIIHNIPREFIVDGEEGLRDIVGMNGLRLEANSTIIGGSSAHIKNLQKSIAENGIDIDDYVLAPLASAEAVLSKRQKELGVVSLDLGGGTTSLAVYEEGNILHTAVLPVGGDNITNDLAIGLKVDVDIAERIKREYGMALPQEINKRDVIDLSQFSPEEEGTVSRKDVAEIMEARLSEIFELVNAELRNIGKEAFLPGGAVLTGGTAKVPHVVELGKDKLNLPVQIGFPREVESVTTSVDDPIYATALGVLFWAIKENGSPESSSFSLPKFAAVSTATEKVKKFLRSLLP